MLAVVCHQHDVVVLEEETELNELERERVGVAATDAADERSLMAEMAEQTEPSSSETYADSHAEARCRNGGHA